ncbi:MAG: hypothetical protein ACP5HQ_01190 [Thermoprotei archaeon]
MAHFAEALGLLGLVFLFVSWLVISLSLFIASRMAGVRISFGNAMITSLLAALAFLAVTVIFDLIGLHALGVLLGIIVVLFVIKARENVGWLHALGIGVLTVIVFFVLAIIVGMLLGVSLLALFA